ncbi:MAG TPA: putative aminohydrolase SsnA [Chloroflexi bacterium]|nr:putative aminohydrolase SsnA [Chloroflexota bacterium]HHW89176.1 putative aminohydrolase SsnA [Chloroflexota bacterium]
MIIHNATVVTFDGDNRILEDGAVRYTGATIDAVGDSEVVRAAYPDDATWNAGGMLLMPGQICAHTHFYGAFARGMYIPGAPAKDFPEILQNLWWKLDKALDLDGVRSSAEVCLVDAIRNGTTTLIDHHASQRAIDGSLDVIADAVLTSGLRAALCYEVTDRDGEAAAQAGIRENVRFRQRVAAGDWHQGRLAATFGLHASLTLSDATLARCAAESDRFHVHVAEHPADEYDSLQKSGKRAVERLHAFGVTGPGSIMAHCIHIDAWETALLAETATFISHQPRSNMNNAVGAAEITPLLRKGLPVCLGNDGFSNDMFAEMKVADMLQKLAHGDPRYLGADKVIQMAVFNNRRLAATFFDHPVGVIAPGAYADLILLDYHPITPLSAANLPWHILFGVSGGHVHSTIAQGVTLMRGRELLTLDEAEIAARSRHQARATWERYWAMF